MKSHWCHIPLISEEDRQTSTTLDTPRLYSYWLTLPASPTPPVYEIVFEPTLPVICTITGGK